MKLEWNAQYTFDTVSHCMTCSPALASTTVCAASSTVALWSLDNSTAVSAISAASRFSGSCATVGMSASTSVEPTLVSVKCCTSGIYTAMDKTKILLCLSQE